MGPRALSALEARRIALRAQGFGRARPPTPSPRHLDAVTRRLGLVQMDSINVLARAHAMPAFSRLGPYDKALLETASYDPRRRTLFEYWGHEASLIRLELQPALRWRMEDARAGLGLYSGLARFAVERRAVIDGVLAALAAHGPASARDLDPGQKRNGAWWGWGETKAALEWLFWGGLVTTLRRRGFERVYDLTERALPASVLARPTPPRAEALRILVTQAASALGVATASDLRLYFRLPATDANRAIAELVEEGTLQPVAVAGWGQPAYLSADPPSSGPLRAQAIVSPFDPLLFERARVERLFGFTYRIEIYVPAAKRQYGYYTLPLLLGDTLVGRVDLRAERKARRLVVASAHLEKTANREAVTAALCLELAEIARWQNLDPPAEIAFDPPK